MSLIRANTCKNCKFSDREAGRLFCRYDPPVYTPIIAMTDKGPQIVAGHTTFIPVADDTWCWKHVRGVERIDSVPTEIKLEVASDL